MNPDSVSSKHHPRDATLRCGRFTLDLSRGCIMAVLNVTPDSFSDGGQFQTLACARAQALRLIDAGADILDIGGESTRPGAEPVSLQQELDRVLPIIESLAGCPVPISIDSRRAKVMQAAVAAGASLINDVGALRGPDVLDVAATLAVPVCIMHMQGEPMSMQHHPEYHQVVDEVVAMLTERVDAALAAGIGRDQIVIDPGFGFGKSLRHNLVLLTGLKKLAAMGLPLLIGVSRKSMLGQLTGRDVNQREVASVVTALFALQQAAGAALEFPAGGSILRVHDVAATRDMLLLLRAVAAANRGILPAG